MDVEWKNIEIEMDSIDWRGNSIHLTEVPAIQNVKTGKIRVYPSDVARAEFKMIAQKHGLNPRDIAFLAMLYVKLGPFEKGQVHYKYHLNKMLFYQWKEMEREGIGETFPHDEFEPAKRGPVPTNLSSDLERLEKMGIVTLKYRQWGKMLQHASLTTELTPTGFSVAEAIWNQTPDPFREVTLKIKKRIFPLNPKTIRDRVHREYPEYKETYVELDTD